jgi:hypothetical protein
MPIHCEIATSWVSDEEFDAIDGAVMRCAYASHNKLGRLCEERVYENDLSMRLRAEGWKDVQTQKGVRVSCCGSEDCGFVVTGLGENLRAYEGQLRSLLGVLPIRGWQWMNFFRNELRLITIE